MQKIEDKTPIHVADMQSTTKGFSQRLHKKSDQWCWFLGANTVMTSEAKLEPSSGIRVSPGAQKECGKRVRTQRRLTNVSALGEIHNKVGEDVGPYLRDDNAVWLLDYVRYQEPETCAESLRCAELRN